MSRRRSDESFVAFARGQRERLTGAAILLGATAGQAAELVEWALATTYPTWSRAARPDLEVVRRVLQSDPGVVEVPWRRRDRAHLIDAGPSPTLAAIPASLQRLPRQQRIVLVGRAYLRLADADLAAVTGLAPEQLRVLDQEARRVVGADDLGARLAAAAAAGSAPVATSTAATSTAATSTAAADDLAHGRWLVRRRRVRVLLGTAAAIVVLALLVVQFRPTPAPVSAPVPDPVPSSPSPSATPSAACPPTRNRCQVEQTRAWRGEIATLVATALDPDGRYFTGGYGYADDDRFQGYWTSSDGALGLTLATRDGTATEVFVQIATSRTSAVRCGELTGHQCVRQRFLDGNTFTLAESVDVTHGMEVQYRPDGDQVITLVARNTATGRSLEIGRGDLIALIQDPRLRLPPR